MPASHLDALVNSTAAKFEQRYHRSPRWIVAAPGRVNLIGEHVDYNDGFVLPMAIERYCVIAAAMSSDAHSSSTATVFSVAADDEAVIDLTVPRRHATSGHWSNYVAGVIAGFLERNIQSRAFQAVIESRVPYGGGLSSSASLEVATATLLEAMTGTSLGFGEKALLCQKAEHEYAGVPCGIMDQFASVMGREGHLMLLDCRSQQIEHIPLTDPGITVLIMNTNVKHELSGGEYAQRRAQCESACRKLGIASLRDATLAMLESRRSQLESIEFRRARHIISEIERTSQAAAALQAGDWPQVGRLMVDSHKSLRDDFEVSCPELDLLVSLAREFGPPRGVIGARMTGGGFGGCTVSLVNTSKVDEIAPAIAQDYHAETGIEPSVLTTRPARGAHVVRAGE